MICFNENGIFHSNITNVIQDRSTVRLQCFPITAIYLCPIHTLENLSNDRPWFVEPQLAVLERFKSDVYPLVAEMTEIPFPAHSTNVI